MQNLIFENEIVGGLNTNKLSRTEEKKREEEYLANQINNEPCLQLKFNLRD